MGGKAISIHALRVEGDDNEILHYSIYTEFLSTPSGWRATHLQYLLSMYQSISIHALRVEGDHNPGMRSKRLANFYPRPPGGGRPEEGAANE